MFDSFCLDFECDQKVQCQSSMGILLILAILLGDQQCSEQIDDGVSKQYLVLETRCIFKFFDDGLSVNALFEVMGSK